MTRPCAAADADAILGVINDGATAYRGVVPPDRLHEPYMSPEELRREMEAGVRFAGYEQDGQLAGVMGTQRVSDVTLIRHAYVRRDWQNHGIGGQLLAHSRALEKGPFLVGTWADADWAIRFYERHGFRTVDARLKDALLRKYWSVPERQIETSVVLADASWQGSPVQDFALTEEREQDGDRPHHRPGRQTRPGPRR